MPMKLMYITNNIDTAKIAQRSGVDRIFIDLETIGKNQRQGHLDTVISYHNLNDISAVRGVLNKSELIVRVNPIHDGSKEEINEVISRGADVIMLPMFKTQQEVETFINYVGGKVKTCLLLETSQALVRIDEILNVDGIDEVHIGLNDLHLSMGLNFMFELLSGGIVEYICEKIKEKDILYGFGGIARIGQGMLPAELILTEHYRLGSQMVILSRSFFSENEIKTEEIISDIFHHNVIKIREIERELIKYNPIQFETNRQKVKQLVNKIVFK